MASRMVQEWLAEYKTLTETEKNTYASTVRANQELVRALYQLLEQETDNEVLEPVCHQLFEFYRSPRVELRRFSLDLLPALIQSYLCRISRKEQKVCSSIEALLLALYNLEIVNPDGEGKVRSFTIPTMAQASIYHEPSHVATLALTESILKHYSHDEPVVINMGPYPQIESVNAQNRMGVLSLLLNCFNADISQMQSHSHYTLCKFASRLGKQGFENLDGRKDSDSLLSESVTSTPSCSPAHRSVSFHTDPRIIVNSAFLVELLTSIYFIMFNGLPEEGIAAVEDLHRRASYELYSDVLLVTNAIKNSLLYNPSGQPQDGPMGIAVTVSPKQPEPVFSKSAITNASFRAKKLPEDIDIAEDGDDASEGPPPHYEDLIENDKAKQEAEKIRSGAKLAKPIKSIMKKAVGRRDSEARRRESESELHKRESTTSGSPRHSGIGINGSAVAVDPSMVNVAVVTGTAHEVVDELEMTPSKRDSYHSYHSDAGADPLRDGGGQLSFSRGILQDSGSLPSDHPTDTIDTKL